MPSYIVTYPLVGEVSVQVEASSEQEAIELGWELTPNGEISWEPMEQIVQGNVFNGPSNSINVEEE